MIQRIQSVFLFLASASLILTFFFPMAEFIGAGDSLVLYVYKVQSLVPDSTNVYDIWFIMPLLAIVSLVTIFSFITIFMYKNRLGQIKVIRFLMFLIAALVGVVFLYYYDVLAKASMAEPNFVQVGAFAPLLSIVFLYFAYRGVVKDEKLIRSADRLR
ncbi:MAG: hypothetical protein C0598_08440 [Marinilabiliales bacterium]|nr:MAG: hypothetical protein C0598_08440 [Marinilabiliales bacterium]